MGEAKIYILHLFKEPYNNEWLYNYGEVVKKTERFSDSSRTMDLSQVKDEEKLSLSRKYSNTLMMTIEPAQEEDAGAYRCVVLTNDGLEMSKTFYLDLLSEDDPEVDWRWDS